MSDESTPPASYLEEATAILRNALKSAEDRYVVNIGRNTPEDRRELLEARIRVAEGFARLAGVESAGASADEAAPGPSALTARVEEALEVAQTYGGTDGEHHKNWVIDQMVRALTGCPAVEKTGTDARGHEYTYEARGESDWYLRVVHEVGEWDEGIAP
jgi:hypothetical protein